MGLVLLVLGLFVWVACTDVSGTEDESGTSPRIGREGTLGRGTLGDSGRAWELNAELVDESLCLELFGISCVAIPDGVAPLQAQLTESGTGPDGGYACAYGAVSSEVERVGVHFAGGVKRDARILPGHGWDADFYIVCIDHDSPIEQIILFDDENEILDPPR